MRTLQLILGAFCAFTGVTMLVVPHQYSSPTYSALQPALPAWGILLLLGGLILLGVVGFSGRRHLVVAAQFFVGAILLLLGAGLSMTASWTGTFNYTILGLGAILAPMVAPRWRQPDGRGYGDPFARLMGVATLGTGLILLLVPTPFNPPLLDSIRPFLPLHIPLFIGGGVALLLVHARPAVPLPWYWAAHLLAGSALILFALHLVPYPTWTGIALYGGTGIAVALLPWLSSRLQGMELNSLRIQTALLLALAAAVPLMLQTSFVTQDEEELATAQVTELKERVANVVANDVANYMALHMAAVEALANQPGLLALPLETQQQQLASFQNAFPHAVAFSTYDAAGNPIARSDGRSGQPIAESALFRDISVTGRPSLELRTSTVTGQPVAALGVPVFEGGTLAGVATASIQLTRLEEVIEEARISEDESIFVVDAQGRLIAARSVIPLTAFTDLSAREPVAALLATQRPSGAFEHGTPGQSRIAGYAQVPELGWTIILERPAAAVLAALRRSREETFGLLLLLTGLALAAGALAASRLTAPLQAVATALDRFATGEESAPLPTSSLPEVHQVTSAFQTLRGRLEHRTVERDRAEQEREEQREWLEVTLASIGDAVIATDVEGRITFMNPIAEQLTGWSKEEALGLPCAGVFHILDATTRKAVESPVDYVLRTGQNFALSDETLLCRRDGKELPIDDSGAPIQGPGEAKRGVVLVFRDVTERQRAAAELRRSEAQLRLITDAIPALVSYVDNTGHYRFNNRAYEQWFGVEVESVANRSLREVLGEEGYRLIEPYVARAQRGQEATYEARVPFKMGDIRHVRASYIPDRGENGEVRGFVALVSDVSEQKRIEEQLREQRETIETVHQIGQLLSAELEIDRLVQSVTDAATSLVGAQFGAFFYNRASHEEGRGRYWLYSLSGVPRSAFENFPMPRNTHVFGPTFRGERVVRYDDVRATSEYGKNPPFNGMPEGHLPVTSYLAVPVISRGGEVLGGLFFGHEVPGVFTEQHERLMEGLAAQTAIAMDNARLFEEAQEAIRLREQFLAVASHELKTPVTTIKGYTDLLLRRAMRSHSVEDRNLRVFETINHEAVRLNNLIDLLLDLSRVQSGRLQLERQALDLASLIHRLVETMQPTLKNHTLDFAGTDDVILVDGDPLRLEQVFRNLLSNAIKYSPDGGTVRLQLTREEGRARVSISDDGIGIPESDLPHLFNQFYRSAHTDKQGISGLGLGLFIVRHLVEAHDGQIHVTSQVGEGSSFTVELPML